MTEVVVEACPKTRDPLEGDPELAGQVVWGCDRPARHTGKHRDAAQGVYWWGK